MSVSKAPSQLLKWRRALLAIALVMVPFVFASGWAHARVSSEVESQGLVFGRSLLELALNNDAGGRLQGATTVLVNGTTFILQTGSVDAGEASLQSLLERVKKDCNRSQAQLSKTLELEVSETRELLSPPLLESLGKTEGYVYCLKPSSEFHLAGLSSMLSDFSKEGDLSAFGRWQGVYARVEERRIVLLSVAILGRLVVQDMFPESKDCPGSDMVELPRPPGRRILSASSDSQTLLTSYVSSNKSAPEFDAYLSRAEATGANVHRMSNKEVQTALLRTLEHSFVVTQTRSNSSQGATLTVARLPH